MPLARKKPRPDQELLDRIAGLERDNQRLRAALIYLADGVDDEVQPVAGSTLAEHVREARAAIRGLPFAPRGALADGHLHPTDLTDGEPT